MLDLARVSEMQHTKVDGASWGGKRRQRIGRSMCSIGQDEGDGGGVVCRRRSRRVSYHSRSSIALAKHGTDASKKLIEMEARLDRSTGAIDSRLHL
nr:hypothetical protein CFP56_11205 [Quercus suber]